MEEEEMIRKTYKRRRITVAIALAAALAAWSAPSAVAFDGRSPDTREAAELVAANGLGDVRSPDTRDAAEQGGSGSSVSVVEARSPDTRDAGQLATSRFSIDARSPDTREAAEQAKPSAVVDGRSPDSRDAAQRMPAAITDAWMGVFSPRSQPEAPAPGLASVDRFHWGDFGIGVGVSVGLMLLFAGLAASALAARQRRGARTGPAMT
jgi:hypothetical protein